MHIPPQPKSCIVRVVHSAAGREAAVKTLAVLLATLTLTGALGAAAPAAAEPERGLASYYADSLHGNKTASGEPYDRNALTGAHRSLDFGTQVIVTYIKTGKSVTVRINDRGPHVKGRIIDLSGAAAGRIGLKDAGVGEVTVEVAD